MRVRLRRGFSRRGAAANVTLISACSSIHSMRPRPLAELVVADAAAPVRQPAAALIVGPAFQPVAVHRPAAAHAAQEALERVRALLGALLPPPALDIPGTGPLRVELRTFA